MPKDTAKPQSATGLQDGLPVLAAKKSDANALRGVLKGADTDDIRDRNERTILLKIGIK